LRNMGIDARAVFRSRYSALKTLGSCSNSCV
jgi:hypothetical protein